jgi:streptogramin lyase
LASNGTLVGNYDPAGANFSAPFAVAIDSAGNAWIPNSGGNTLTELNSSGALGGNFAPAGANFSDPISLAIDASGNVWVANASPDSVAEIIGAAGPVLTPLEACLTQQTPKAVCKP